MQSIGFLLVSILAMFVSILFLNSKLESIDLIENAYKSQAKAYIYDRKTEFSSGRPVGSRFFLYFILKEREKDTFKLEFSPSSNSHNICVGDSLNVAYDSQNPNDSIVIYDGYYSARNFLIIALIVSAVSIVFFARMTYIYWNSPVFEEISYIDLLIRALRKFLS